MRALRPCLRFKTLNFKMPGTLLAPLPRNIMIGLALALSGVVWTSPLAAQTYGKRVFGSLYSCEASTLLSREECKNAFDNARAEVDEKAPRFSSRGECERLFHRCAIAGFLGKGAEFQPALRSVEIIVRSAADKTATPLLDGDALALGLQSRTALRQDVGKSLSRRAQARAQWRERLKAQEAQNQNRAAPEAYSESSDQSSAYFYGDMDSMPTASLPPPDPAAEARRRERIRNAPFIP